MTDNKIQKFGIEQVDYIDTTGEDVTNDPDKLVFRCNFFLRPTIELNICLPLNLTQEEADRMAQVIRSLPFKR